jgi:hypothetical protein
MPSIDSRITKLEEHAPPRPEPVDLSHLSEEQMDELDAIISRAGYPASLSNLSVLDLRRLRAICRLADH